MQKNKDKLVLKVCPDPGCSAVWHNIPKAYTKCNDCDGRVIQINMETYKKKFSCWYFQYDFQTGEFYRPEIEETNNNVLN